MLQDARFSARGKFEMHQGEVSRGLASIINARPFADLLLVYVSKASYFPTGKETLAQAVGCIWCEM